MWPTIATPCWERSNKCTTAMPNATATSDAGTLGANRRNPTTIANERTPTMSVRHCVSSRWRRKSPGLLEEVALHLLEAEDLGQLPDDDGQRQPDDEALHHRFGDEVGDEAES